MTNKEEIKQIFLQAKEENDLLTMIELSKEFVLPNEVRSIVYNVCYNLNNFK